LLSDTIALSWRPETRWDALLSNGTSDMSKPVSNTGLIYGMQPNIHIEFMMFKSLAVGDYYFVKAGNLLLSTGVAKCS
jgi:hypothetical protein